MTALVIVTAGLVYLLGLNEAKVTQLTRQLNELKAKDKHKTTKL